MFDLFFNFLHNFKPQPIILRLGFFNVYWYSFLIVLGLVLGLILVFKLAPRFKIKKENLEDLIFYLIIAGFIGARLYHVFSELPYYFKNPLDVFKVWNGGLGIYGAIIAGLLILFFSAKKYKIKFFVLADLFVPALALGQAIGRWGNYFNQEVFGRPTDLPWGIFIEAANRPFEFFSEQYFHPTFLYESIWNFLIFFVLILMIKSNFYRNFFGENFYGGRTSKENRSGVIFGFYLMFYSFGRFWLEFIRIDSQPMLLGLRLAQVISILMFIVGGVILMRKYKILE
ncbi:MAG: prolipoprotein diacylglyceryl transferase [Patescibacteria group bacterium]|nr:prolipoprotein diacylglyceryl transferase [Patescibacteria group bacterium]MDD5172832.1 prolipoprotein diacylglyceryl transferase [Patescibacteria group bacterium]